MAVEPLVVSVPDAAVMLDLNEYTVWRWVHSRKIESIKIGKSRKIRVEEIKRLLDESTIPPRKQ